jgi:cellulose synthase/poly-beta-1,6-N-acetylglucosamine synthase-like glycosyltransferase
VQILNIISVVLLICYASILLFFIKGWWSLKNGQPLQSQFKTTVSVLVPVRNEEKHIANLLQDLIAQNYPASLFNIIVIDDHSTDQTAAIVRSFSNSNLRLLNLTLEKPINSYKKRAIATAIAYSKNDGTAGLASVVGWRVYYKIKILIAIALY